MKQLFCIIAFIFILSGCMFQQPDYLHTISPPELNRIMENGKIFLVDVHTPEQRHIKGTTLFMPFNKIEAYKDKLPADKNTPIYLYCAGGPMGNAAARTLNELGYTHLFNLEGGAEAWKAAGLDFQ